MKVNYFVEHNDFHLDMNSYSLMCGWHEFVLSQVWTVRGVALNRTPIWIRCCINVWFCRKCILSCDANENFFDFLEVECFYWIHMPYFIFISPLVYQYFLTTISLSKKLGEKLNEFSFQILELKTENEFRNHLCYCIEFQSDFNSFASTCLHRL